MKRIIVILVLVFLSCNDRKTVEEVSKEIIGNWYLENNTMAKSFDYQEVYIDARKIYIFTSSNYAISFAQDYVVDESNMYYLSKDRTDTISKMKILVGDKSLVLKNRKGKIVYKKNEGYWNLSNYIDNVISKKDFDENFTRRMDSIHSPPRSR